MSNKKMHSLANRKETNYSALPQIELPPSITVKRLADTLKIEPVKVIKQLMRKGIMANVNQAIDFDTAAVVALDFGYSARGKIERQILPSLEGLGDKLQIRSPVITVMGHVDHGKTTLLDAIRKTNVTAHEAGAITQHIGAYQTTVDGRKITFLDTPGHEAFTAMRARGAWTTDIVVLVIAADDGVMPQTVEAIDHAKAAKVPIVVAINKIDKPEANIERVKQQLADLGLVIEEWGGDVVCVPISAKKEQGISDLLENLFLVADILELKADPNCAAEGVVIEAKLDKTKGPLATLLVQKGTLEVSNIVVAGNTWGKIKAMFNDKRRRVSKAAPSTPVEILGINGVPGAGELFAVVTDEHQARGIVAEHEAVRTRTPLSLSTLSSQISHGEVKELNVILKTDVQGSIEPIKNSIEQLSTEKVRAKVIHAASGSITEGDVLLASASKGIVIGFNSDPAPGARQLAEAEGVTIQRYDVIYRLEEDVGKALKGMLEPTYAEVLGGRAEVRATFAAGKRGKVAGVYVKEGKVWRDAKVKVLRQNEVVCESRVSSLRRFKEDATEVVAGLECGIGIEGFTDFYIGDIIESYRKERVS
ncbi:MAG: translation initiation factor IF-2 [Dehalococcoidia bacterium]|nr:translation initiation factor IF-2 [Dehalococcoidia bacterium]